LISKGGRSNSQVFSIVKVSAIDLAFTSICVLLIGGTPFCGKIVVKNKEKFASNYFFPYWCLFHYPMHPFVEVHDFLKTIRFVAKPTNRKIDNKFKRYMP